MIFYLKDTLLRNMIHNTSIQNQNFSILCLILAEISMRFHSKTTPWEKWHITLQFQIKFSQFCAYFWLKLVWNVIEKIPPWEIWHITVLFKIKIFSFCAYFWLKLVWVFSQTIPPWGIWHKTLLFQIKIFQFCAYFWLKLVWNFI